MAGVATLNEEDQQILSTIHRFVERDVKPVASEMEHNDEYPHELVEKMKQLGLFGAIIPNRYGGLGLSFELAFEDFSTPASSLIGGQEGQGFKQVMGGLEVGRINVAARAVGVAQAAFEEAIRYAQQRETFGKPICEHQAIQLKLAEMATKIEASRLLVRQASLK